jgi:hypothetical protein
MDSVAMVELAVGVLMASAAMRTTSSRLVMEIARIADLF